MDFKQIEAFANVVKYKSFSKAGDACFLTQPTISAHIGTLEKELGIQLIDRGSKEVKPTKQGELFFKYAIDMINTRERAIHSLQGFSSNIEGILEIQASTIPGQYLVPQLMCQFKEKYPKVRYYMEQSGSRMVMENLLEHKGEIGFTGDKGVDRLDYSLLKKDKVVLITPDNRKFRQIYEKSKTIQLKDFIKEPFLFREKGSGTRKEFEEKITGMGYIAKNLNVVARINSMGAIKQAVSYGLGISMVSEIAVDTGCERDQKGYLHFTIEDCNMDRAFYLVTNPKVCLSPAAETFKNFTMACYSEK
ncbi:MAG: selenium metabolism-associated LysR family transcriptional regulator [Anaerovorax sp.]